MQQMDQPNFSGIGNGIELQDLSIELLRERRLRDKRCELDSNPARLVDR